MTGLKVSVQSTNSRSFANYLANTKQFVHVKIGICDVASHGLPFMIEK